MRLVRLILKIRMDGLSNWLGEAAEYEEAGMRV